MAISDKDHKARIERLSRRDQDSRPAAASSPFIRMLRLVLPLAAVGIFAALFIGNDMNEDVIIPSAEQSQDMPKEIVENELLNPKFESRDKKDNPYQITADRAVQGKTNKELIMLEKPVGTMTLGDGKTVNLTSRSGAYRQDTERFYLDGDVHIENSDGYVLESAEAHMDLKNSLAWSEKDVSGMGPDMEIKASGMKANVKTGEVIFTGPAKLTLKEGFEGL